METPIISRDDHLITVWLHELQDRANVIANMAAVDLPELFRNTWYEAFGQGLANDDTYLSKVRESESSAIQEFSDDAQILRLAKFAGYDAGSRIQQKIRAEDRPAYRLKIYEKLRDRMQKIHPWDDQTKKPL